MDHVLKDLVGERIQIIGIETHRDEGTLVAFDDLWVVIERTGVGFGSVTETLYFPIANIRLLKPV